MKKTTIINNKTHKQNKDNNRKHHRTVPMCECGWPVWGGREIGCLLCSSTASI